MTLAKSDFPFTGENSIIFLKRRFRVEDPSFFRRHGQLCTGDCWEHGGREYRCRIVHTVPDLLRDVEERVALLSVAGDGGRDLEKLQVPLLP